jgi:hypothetical protein
MFWNYQKHIKGRSSWATAHGVNLYGALRSHWNLGIMVLVNSGLHKRKNFSENYPQLGMLRNKCRQPYAIPKKFKEYRSEGTSNY